jgi:hypothetical protein
MERKRAWSGGWQVLPVALIVGGWLAGPWQAASAGPAPGGAGAGGGVVVARCCADLAYRA